MRLNRILGLTVLALLLQCSDEEALFSGITETNVNAELTGKVDNTDWKIDERWSSKEIKLFADLELSNVNNSGIDGNEKKRIIGEMGECFEGGRIRGVCNVEKLMYPSYPNPATAHFNFRLNAPLTSIEAFKFVIVDNSFSILESQAQLSSTYSLHVGDGESLTGGNTYRIYYIFKTVHGEFIFKGHGDIIVR